LSGARYFTKLVICEAYHRLQIVPGDEWKTAFGTCYGHYNYTVILLGLVNAPAAFQGPINNMLRKHLDQFCIAYLDDIVAYSNLLKKHREHVQLILVKLQEAGPFLKLSKCELEMQRISFFGFIVMLEGGKMKLDRVRTTAEWPEQTCHHVIQVFLHFTNFYWPFNSSFSYLAKLMTDMLNGGKNGQFIWALPTHSGQIGVFYRATRRLHQGPRAAPFRSCQAIVSQD
jgi:hypothetical protein